MIGLKPTAAQINKADIAPAACVGQRAADRAGCWPLQPPAPCAGRHTLRRANVSVSAKTRERRRGTELPRLELKHD